MMISNAMYDRLKFLVQVALPAAGTLYFALAGLWGLPAAEQVVGTIVAFTTFLGVLLGISTKNYNRDIAEGGELVVERYPEGNQFRLELDEDVEALARKREVRLHVVRKKGS